MKAQLAATAAGASRLAGAAPMLIHLAQIRSELTLSEAVEATCEAGQRYIRVGSEIMSRRT